MMLRGHEMNTRAHDTHTHTHTQHTHTHTHGNVHIIINPQYIGGTKTGRCLIGVSFYECKWILKFLSPFC